MGRGARGGDVGAGKEIRMREGDVSCWGRGEQRGIVKIFEGREIWTGNGPGDWG